MSWVSKRPILLGYFNIIVSVIFIINIFNPDLAQAKEISLEEAISWGIEHNSSLKEIKNNVESIQRSLDILETEYGFKTQISANPVIAGGFETDEEEDSSSTTSTTSPEIKLKTSKLFSNGISIQSEISLKEEDWFNLEGLTEGAKRSLSVSKTIYPLIPIEIEQEKYSTSNELVKEQRVLEWQQGVKKIDFLETYFSILRLKEKLVLAQKNFEYAEENLTKVLKSREIGEAGENQEMEARIALKTAEINLLEAQNNFQQAKANWYLDLGLNEDEEITLEEKTPFVEELTQKIESLEVDLDKDNMERLMDLVISNHYQLKNNLLDQEATQKEIEWQKANKKPRIDLYGAYTSKNNVWGIGAELSYNITDGGKQKLEEEGYRVKLENLKEDYQYIIDQLALEMSRLLNQQKVLELSLEEKIINLQKAQLEKKFYQEQFQRGLISKTEFQQKLLIIENAEIDFKSAQDALLINKLRIFHFLGMSSL
ncbi:MAG TPA: hypothetical protein DEG96_05845 [Candidatus Atribacteria bacterium]|nr:hypothetical protein [Candidatus Atribacteria bacterium]